MNEENIPPSPPSFGERLRSAIAAFLRALFRLTVFTLILVLLGLIVIGIPALYRQYLQPIQTNLQGLEITQTYLEQANQQLALQVEELQKHLNALEVRGDAEKQAFSELSAQAQNASSTQQAQMSALESTQMTAIASSKEIDAALKEVSKKITRLTAALEQTNTSLTEIDQRVNDLDAQLKDEEAPVAALRRELLLVKAMELLTRSRLFLVENNLGLAADDIQAARGILADLQVPSYQAETLAEVIQRLDVALGNLPAAPILAAEDLEIAWQLLTRGLPGEPPIATPSEVAPATSTPEVTAQPGPSPTPTPTLTATPTP
jgi:hypothetical protein